jgi:hypothetical protein
MATETESAREQATDFSVDAFHFFESWASVPQEMKNVHEKACATIV